MGRISKLNLYKLWVNEHWYEVHREVYKGAPDLKWYPGHTFCHILCNTSFSCLPVLSVYYTFRKLFLLFFCLLLVDILLPFSALLFTVLLACLNEQQRKLWYLNTLEKEKRWQTVLGCNNQGQGGSFQTKVVFSERGPWTNKMQKHSSIPGGRPYLPSSSLQS